MLITKSCSCLLIGTVLGLLVSSCCASSSGSSSSSSTSSSLEQSSILSSPLDRSSTSPLFDDRTSHVVADRNATIGYRSRRRRFVRFPALPPSYVLEGAGPPPPHALPPVRESRNLGFASVRFGSAIPGPSQYPTWRQQKSYWRQHSGPPPPVALGGAEYPARAAAPVMGHRTPRLIFRDNDFPVVSGSTNNFFQSNQLPEVEEDFRGKSDEKYIKSRV